MGLAARARDAARNRLLLAALLVAVLAARLSRNVQPCEVARAPSRRIRRMQYESLREQLEAQERTVVGNWIAYRARATSAWQNEDGLQDGLNWIQ
jgi:hypothetical protein